MPFQISRGSVPRGQDAPSAFAAEAMAFTDGRESAGERDPEVEGVDQSGIAAGVARSGSGRS